MADDNDDELPDNFVHMSFNVRSGSKLQHLLPAHAEFASQGRPIKVIIIPPPKGRPQTECTRIAIFQARGDGYYAMHTSMENGHSSFSAQYKPDETALSEHLVSLGFPQKELAKIGLVDVASALGEANEFMSKLYAGSKGKAPGGSKPA